MDFKEIESKWQSKWEKEELFKTKSSKSKKRFYCLEMFPYPSASFLHMGHVRNYTIGDIIARYKRMSGFNVLYPMGYDSFGLPAENAAKKQNIHPKIYTEDAIKKIMEYQKALGNSYDWSRKIASHEPEYYKWNQYFFLKFLEKGLVYRKKAPVNWCPSCNSVLANEEVVNGKCWRHEETEVIQKELEQWFLKTTAYAEEILKDIDNLEWSDRIKNLQRNWIGKSEGLLIDFQIKNSKNKLQVFTTRPDTIYGVTFLVISPKHELINELSKINKKELEKLSKTEKDSKEGVFLESYAINPLTKEEVPIYAANFVVAEYGTGAVMAVPAHDQRDFEFAKKYNIPIIQVIAKEAPIRSYLMGAKNIIEKDLQNLGIKIVEKTKDDDLKIEIPKSAIKKYEELITNKLEFGFWNEYIGLETIFIFKDKKGKTERLILNKSTEKIIDKKAAEYIGENWDKKCVWKWLSENEFYKDLIIHEGSGILINSDQFNNLNSKEAIKEISNFIEKKKLGKKVTNYKLRDWLISRQRYWGTPIPIIYCDKCGTIPVKEKDLPVLLPEKVDFKLDGNPLKHVKEFTEVKCPKCNSKAKRETDTMGGFVDSSWYFLRFCSPKENKAPFDKKEVEYWMPVDQYIGGIEHAVGHLIYSRFFTKALRDLKMLNIDEPFTRLFNQGVVYKDGHKMSKSFGNIVTQTEISEKYGIDTARVFLMSVASPESDMEWSDKGVEGSFRFLQKLWKISELNFEKINEKDLHKLNLTIKNYTTLLETFNFNLAVIELIKFTDYILEHPTKECFESLLKLVSPFAPHTAEELWSKLKNKSFISIEKWPVIDEKKINLKLEEQEKNTEKLIYDINNIVKIFKEKSKEVSKAFLYVIPNEKSNYLENLELIKKKTNLEINIFAVNDKNKYDPENKAQKSKPNKPAIYLE